MLSDVVGVLICPVCSAGLEPRGGSLGCVNGHRFDIARQGYVNLLTGAPHTGTADTPEMVRAREAFLSAGHFAPLAEAVADAVPYGPGLVVDAGAGTGYYLAEVLDRRPEAAGLALDVSKHALRRAARAHERAGAVVWDVWRPLPIRDGAATAVINVFAPRNGPEFRRVLGPGGVLVVVTPTPGHLRELVGRLGLLSVDERKEARTAAALSGFAPRRRRLTEFPVRLARADVAAVVLMGPSAWHVDPGRLGEDVAALPEPLEVTASFHVSEYVPESGGVPQTGGVPESGRVPDSG
ncbi:putative RNA methyltransferase [Bailinhaonella thermotolerans]|uniref:putative RNA methyltransferase n=1 Tax=Bailinhaonella thermotolerans TaxID=1070861 RepID=UPI001F5B158F|nr:methyltransferase domain-containing protein [Bailinhaonella thermotolerans]